MKIKNLITTLLIIVLLIPFVSHITADTSKDQPKKFEVTFTVTYNAITLEAAAEKEKDFRKRYIDACNVDVTIKEVSGMTFSTLQWQTIQVDSQLDSELTPGEKNALENATREFVSISEFKNKENF